jgi:hypothetical protein
MARLLSIIRPVEYAWLHTGPFCVSEQDPEAIRIQSATMAVDWFGPGTQVWLLADPKYYYINNQSRNMTCRYEKIAPVDRSNETTVVISDLQDKPCHASCQLHPERCCPSRSGMVPTSVELGLCTI